MAEITPEIIEAAKARESRFRDIDLAIQVETELSSTAAVRIVLEQAQREAAEALDALAYANPVDHNRIIELQSIVYRARFIRATLNAVLARGRQAEASLRDAEPQE